MRLTYPATLRSDPEGGVRVTFPDLPGVRARGGDHYTAVARAAGALARALHGCVVHDLAPPAPSLADDDQTLISVPPIQAAKLCVHSAMRARGFSASELAHHVGMPEDRITTLLSPGGAVNDEDLYRVLEALGKRVTIAVEDTTSPAIQKSSPMTPQHPAPEASSMGASEGVKLR